MKQNTRQKQVVGWSLFEYPQGLYTQNPRSTRDPDNRDHHLPSKYLTIFDLVFFASWSCVFSEPKAKASLPVINGIPRTGEEDQRLLIADYPFPVLLFQK